MKNHREITPEETDGSPLSPQSLQKARQAKCANAPPFGSAAPMPSRSSKFRAPPRTQPGNQRGASNPTWQSSENTPPTAQNFVASSTPATASGNTGERSSEKDNTEGAIHIPSKESWWQTALTSVGQWAKVAQENLGKSEVKTPREKSGTKGDKSSEAPQEPMMRDEEAEALVNYCFYLGADVNEHPEIIPLVAQMFWQPLPDNWKAFHTEKNSEHGEGYTYYWNSETGRTQWVHPNEDDHVHLLEKKVRKVIPGTRIWFRRNEDARNAQIYSLFSDQTKHLPDKRPLLRSGTKASALFNGVIDCALKNNFPQLHPAVLAVFASYFDIEKYEDIPMWGGFLVKLAAVCPIPPGWTFKFDEHTCEAVYVRGDHFCTKRHPMDAFFSVMLDLLFRRHYLWRMKGGETRLTEYFAENANAAVAKSEALPNPSVQSQPFHPESAPFAPVTPTAPLPPDIDRPRGPLAPTPALGCQFGDKRPPKAAPRQLDPAELKARRAEQDMALARGFSGKFGPAQLTVQSEAARDDGPGEPSSPPPPPPPRAKEDAANHPEKSAKSSKKEKKQARDAKDAPPPTNTSQQPTQEKLPDAPPPLSNSASSRDGDCMQDTPPRTQNAPRNVDRGEGDKGAKAPSIARPTAVESAVKAGSESLPSDRSLPDSTQCGEKTREPQAASASRAKDRAKKGDASPSAPTRPASEHPSPKSAEGRKPLASDVPPVPGVDIPPCPPPPPAAVRAKEGAPPPAAAEAPKSHGQKNGEEKGARKKDAQPPTDNPKGNKERAQPSDSSGPAKLPSGPAGECPSAPSSGSREAQPDEQSSLPSVPPPPPAGGDAKVPDALPVRDSAKKSSKNDEKLTEVLQLTEKLQFAPDDDVLEILQALGKIDMTISILQESKVGVSTQRFKAHKDPAVQEYVKVLRTQWKNVIMQKKKVEGSHKMPPPSPRLSPRGRSPASDVEERIVPVRRRFEGSHQSTRVNTQAIQWLCRLFLEQREALYDLLVDRVGTDEADRIRGHLDVVRFRTLVTDAVEEGQHRPLQSFMKRFAGTTLTSTSCSVPMGEKWWDIIVKAIDAKKDTAAEDWARKDLPRLLADIGQCLSEIKKAPADPAPFTLPEGAASCPQRNSSPQRIPPSSHPAAAQATVDLKPPSSLPVNPLGSTAFPSPVPGGSPMRRPPSQSPVRRAPTSPVSPDEGEESDSSLGAIARAMGRPDPFGHDTPLQLQDDGDLTPPLSPVAAMRPLEPQLWGKLSSYASASFEKIESALECYLPGACICTAGVLEQLTDGELLICQHLMEALTVGVNQSLMEAFKERDELRSDIQHRHQYANMLYAKANKSAFTPGLF